MDGKIENVKEKVEMVKEKLQDLGRKEALAIVTLAVILTGTYVLAGPASSLVNGEALNSETLTFEANGTALNVSGNDTVDLGIATGEKLNFGRIPVEAKSTKFFNINAREKALLVVRAEGNISEALNFERAHYFEGSREVKLEFDPETVDHFEGNVKVTVKTAANEVGSEWLGLRSKLY